MAKSKIDLSTKELFLTYVIDKIKTKKFLNLNVENQDIIVKLSNFYDFSTPAMRQPSFLKTNLMKYLKLEFNSSRSINHYIERGFSEEYGREKVDKLQKHRYELGKTLIRPDFKFNNKLIEFKGDNIHGNPAKFKGLDILTYYKNKSPNKPITASYMWWSNYARTQVMKELGFEILNIWEDDYRKSPQDIINRCGDFLGVTLNNRHFAGGN